jgi:hypothetical protein
MHISQSFSSPKCATHKVKWGKHGVGPKSYKQGCARAPVITCDRSTCVLLSHIITGVRVRRCARRASVYNVCPCWQLTWRFGYAQACLNSSAHTAIKVRVSLQMRIDDGLIATFEAINFVHLPRRVLEIFGSDYITLDSWTLNTTSP